jgi:3-deoxy-D-manno-octulosonate 8-phosphate phosphatase KdsC-like HAD superfamily phosphatase
MTGPAVRSGWKASKATTGRKAEFWHTRQKHELPLDWETCIGIGDDIEDQPFLEKCELAFCPKDADPRLGTPTITELPITGGQGVMCYIEAEIQLLNENKPSHALYY